MTVRHFLALKDISSEDLQAMLARARAMKSARKGMPKAAPDKDAALRGQMLALVFEQPSTRTRVSFDVAMRQLGGALLTLNKSELQLGRGETIGDTAKVLSRYVDIIMVRTDKEEKLLEMARHAGVPVINGLTDKGHPCQVLADALTLEEHFGSIKSKTVAWIGDCNNMCLSWMEASAKLDFALRISGPKAYQPTDEMLARAKASGAKIAVFDDPARAVEGADCVTTDAWASMNHSDREARVAAFRPYQVNEALMTRAVKGAVFLHCLPAHRGEEVTDGVLDGPGSLVWDEAENRLHIQKAILRWCLGL